jgi:hypothetical protein
MNVPIEIDVENYTFEIVTTLLIDEAPNHSCRDSADDYRGTRELEWKMVYAVERTETGRIVACGMLDTWMAYLTQEHGEAITAKLWELRDAHMAEGDAL